MLTLSVFSAAAAPLPGHSSSISRSRETTRFALNSRTARSARCREPPIDTASPSTRTSSGPRTRNSKWLCTRSIVPQRLRFD